MKNKWTIATLCIVLALGFWIYSNVHLHPSARSNVTASVPSQLTFGEIFTEITTNWGAAIVNDPHVLVMNCHVLEKGMYYQVMFDKDTNKIYTLSPIDSPVRNFVDYTNIWTVMETRILPGQRITRAQYAYNRRPR